MTAVSALPARGEKSHRAKGTTKVVARRVMHDRSIHVRILARDVYHKRIWLERLFNCAALRLALTISHNENSLQHLTRQPLILDANLAVCCIASLPAAWLASHENDRAPEP